MSKVRTCKSTVEESLDTVGYNYVKIFDPPWGRNYSRAYSRQYDSLDPSEAFLLVALSAERGRDTPQMGRTGSGRTTTGYPRSLGNARARLTNPASSNPYALQ